MYDFIVLGGGPGGYVAAIRAAQSGATVAVIEKDSLGGTCLNWGCIPTKSLLESGHMYRKMLNSTKFGISCDNIKPDIGKMVSRSREIVEKLTSGVAHLLKKHNVTIYKGHGRIVKCSDHIELSVNVRDIIAAKHLIIATGATSRIPNGISVDGEMIWTSKEAMVPKEIPESLLVIGGGVIGLEFASFFNALGTKVTIAEYSSGILSNADEDIAKFMTKSLTNAGIAIQTNAKIESVSIFDGQVTAKIVRNGITSEAKVSKCLVATGIAPNITDIGLENAAGVSVERGCIQTGSFGETGQPNVYAIGDVTAGPWLAHKAMQDGIRCVDKVMGKDVQKLGAVPACVYTMPQIAQVGLTEKQCSGLDISIATYPLHANGKALTEDNNGFVKVIFEKKTGIFLGAHMVGDHVTELIHSYSLLHTLEGLADDICNTVFPHPTLSEVLQEAAMSAMGQGLHI